MSGDTDYIFDVPTTAALTAWVDSVNANTVNTSTVITATSTIFSPTGIAGTYTVYGQITSLQTGTMPAGSATFTDPGPSTKNLGGCKPGMMCTE